MDRFSTLPFEIRTHIYSYYFNAHDSYFCKLRIVTAEPARIEATETPTRTMSQATSKLEEHTRSSTSKIAELIRQIQGTASALIEAQKEAVRVGKPTSISSVILHARAVGELSRVMDETEIAFQVRPRAPCRRFFALAHVNRRLRADLLSTCEFDLSGHKKMVITLLPKRSVGWRASIALVHVHIGEGGLYTSKAYLRFAHVNSLPNF